MTEAFIGLGSNLGDSLQVLLDGWKRLGETPGVHLTNISSPYRTEPVGMKSSHWFVNAAGSVKTTLPPSELLAELLRIEALFGRQRSHAGQGYSDRILDFDLLLYGDDVITAPGLEIPHPQIHRRLFVLKPLSEIASGVVHPVCNETIGRLCADLTDNRQHPVVEKLSWPKGQKNTKGITPERSIG